MLNQFYSNLSGIGKKLFWVAALSFVVALLTHTLIYPGLGRLKKVKQTIQQEKDTIEVYLRTINEKDEIRKHNSLYEEYFTKELDSDDDINAKLFGKVTSLAAEAKINLTKSNPSDKKIEKEYIEYFADLECNGELNNIITFVHLLNSSKDLLKVVNFSMTPKRGEEGGVNATMKIVKLVINPTMSNEVSSPE